MTDRSTTTAVVPSSAGPGVGHDRAGASSLSRSAGSLAAAARAFRETSDAQHDAEELARAFALVEAALGDLAAGAERAAYVTTEGSRRRRDGPAGGVSLAAARALSWRLHGLRGQLVAARRICSEVTRVLDGAVRR